LKEIGEKHKNTAKDICTKILELTQKRAAGKISDYAFKTSIRSYKSAIAKELKAAKNEAARALGEQVDKVLTFFLNTVVPIIIKSIVA
jgi:hypothetical protein